MYIWDMTIPKHGITADRKTPENLQFIIDNYEKMTRPELAKSLGQTERWIKRQVALLKKSGAITPKRKPPAIIADESLWTPTLKERAQHLLLHEKMCYEDIASRIQQEFNIPLTKHAVGWWLRRFGCGAVTNKEWLKNHVTKQDIEAMLSRGLRVADMTREINSSRGVHVNDDDLLVYIKSIGLDGQRWYRIKNVRKVVSDFEGGKFEEALKEAGSVSELSRRLSVSKTVINRRIVEDDIELPEQRIAWSGELESLRNSLEVCPPMSIRPKDGDAHQMILGWLLGDGHLDLHGRFVVNHSLAQLSYLYVKRQILRPYLNNIVTVPRKGQAYEDGVIISEEQLGISCPGLQDYCRYLNKDGSKNHEMIASELNDLGIACYFMDDGSKGNVVSVSRSVADRLTGKFFLKEKVRPNLLRILPPKSQCILPSFWYKLDEVNPGGYWSNFFPELFTVRVSDDLTVSFMNSWVANRDADSVSSATEYYHRRGFPWPSYSDDYLLRSWEMIKSFESRHLWKDTDTLRYANVGDELIRHFMRHMSEASRRGTSPMKTFSGFSTLSSTIEYCLKSKKSALPKFLHDALMYFSGGVTAFPSVVAKAVADRFCVGGGIVVDPCAGWGGRMLGTLSSGRRYVGFEPWEKTSRALEELASYVSATASTIVPGPFSPDMAPTVSDLIFTSPPYVDLEVYGTPMSLGEWKKLMTDIVSYAEKSLRPAGHLVLNIPERLRHMMPKTSLAERPTRYWNTRSRRRRGEPLYVWQRE